MCGFGLWVNPGRITVIERCEALARSAASPVVIVIDRSLASEGESSLQVV